MSGDYLDKSNREQDKDNSISDPEKILEQYGMDQPQTQNDMS